MKLALSWLESTALSILTGFLAGVLSMLTRTPILIIIIIITSFVRLFPLLSTNALSIFNQSFSLHGGAGSNEISLSLQLSLLLSSFCRRVYRNAAAITLLCTNK